MPKLNIALLGGLLLAVGCHKGGATPGKAPFEAFAGSQFRTPKNVVIEAPDPSKQDWRVMVLQEKPRPKKNPHWKTIPVGESGSLEMPAGSHFKCIYNPVLFRAWPNERVSAVVRWDLIRGVRCTSDEWSTYSQAQHVVSVSGDGSTVTSALEQTELNLHELIGGQPVDTTILLRPK